MVRSTVTSIAIIAHFISNKDFKAEVTICDHKGLPKDKYVPEDKFEVPDITHQESDTEFDPSKVDAAKDEVYVLEQPKEERRRALLGPSRSSAVWKTLQRAHPGAVWLYQGWILGGDDDFTRGLVAGDGRAADQRWHVGRLVQRPAVVLQVGAAHAGRLHLDDDVQRPGRRVRHLEVLDLAVPGKYDTSHRGSYAMDLWLCGREGA